ncbi:FG-GAP repeat domain-containing protein [Haliangium sp.]|uniref:FG-GAP repeat domain-containing protein n=1 Tax=Haliangium sp. TaxID=2663208 RepID=UPI003D13D303
MRPLRPSVCAALAGPSLLLLALSCGCAHERGARDGDAAPGPLGYRDVTATHLPSGDLDGLSMDAKPIDVDGDGDLDLMIANEFRPNILLINDGQGRFRNDSDARIPQVNHDSEDVGVADFDRDGDLDIVVVSEDDQIDELYFNRGDGRFTDEGARIPVQSTTNGVIVADLDGDGGPDLVLANRGQNQILINDGSGGFVDQTEARLPAVDDITQDVELGDVDGDGDLDLLVGNEGANRLLLNDGTGRFTDAPAGALPGRAAPEETREADFGDADGDGDLDIVYANVRFFVDGAALENRLLLNDGAGRFTDAGDRLPQHDDSTVDADFVDLDGDGDQDLVTCNTDGLGTPAPFRALLNDGGGRFRDGTAEMFPTSAAGTCFDVEAADFDGDGLLDLYFANRRGADRLLLRNPP